ncbi:EAL domain-containing protein [Ideonella azotifigens]|uniref:EAL domain-containing protein n=3 Tax=Ideonella azotifigens TaxID=513160 RepID=A0ABN1JMW2_9BURK|nr:EAL domain-containing protein [Ideonella azotifigens]MCD2339880.1 EAL domain-containing protein [Ideonella azotifigens]
MKRRNLFNGLAGRIVTLFLGLLLVVQLAAFLTVRESIDRNARRMLGDQLQLGERVLGRLLDQNAQGLRQGATLLAADFGFRAAVQSGDAETVRSALENQAARIGASVSALLDVNGGLVAVSSQEIARPSPIFLDPQGRPDAQRQVLGRSSDAEGLDPVLLALAAERRQSGGEQAPLRLVHGQAMQFVVVPMKAPLLIGWVVMGFPLQNALAQDLHALSGLDMVLFSQTAGQAPHLALGTTAVGRVAAMVDAGPGMSEGELDGISVLRLRVDLLPASAPGGGRGSLHAVLFRSIDEAVAPFRRLQASMALITVLAVSIFGVGSVLTARRVTQPVRQLLRASERLGAGDFQTPVPQTGRDDELGELAQAFDGMRTGLAARTEEIRLLAYWDRLTGLPNRAQFEDLLRRELQPGRPVALLMLNLDRLEQVNQVLGRARGDRLLQTAAERLRGVARRLSELPASIDGFVARLAGDEFALLLPGASPARAQWVAQSVVRSFERPVQLDDSVVDLSAGIGIACFPEHAEHADQLMGRALLAMTEAKRRMAGCLVYDPSIDAGSAQTLSLLGELRHALRHGELRLFLQPKLRLADGSLIGAEALVRWQHPTRGLVPPNQFIPFAEETGFIHELTLWVVDEAARVWAQHRAQGLELRLSVNLSAHDLMKADLVARIDARLRHHDVPPSALCLEITESAIASDPQRALQTLHALKTSGYKLSIDDFGAGYTSLGQLIDLPVNELKIDMLFVRTMDTNADKASMVRFIIGLAHDCRLTVVAEGVENPAILAQLSALGCDEAQGYHISKPLPSGELVDWVRGRWPGLVSPPATAPVEDLGADAAPKLPKAWRNSANDTPVPAEHSA